MRDIAPKPTVFQGIEFRSRLEARWAVFFAACPSVEACRYEPLTLRYAKAGWDYTPDFSIDLPNNKGVLVEVKPILPNENYMRGLSQIVEVFSKRLLLGVGDFYGSTPRIAQVTPHRFHHMAFGRKAKPLNEFFPGSDQAVLIASRYRFDL